jgi:hypothetical protein
LDTLAETLKNTPEEIEESEGKYVPNPVRQSLLNKYSQYSTEYQNELDRALFPQVKAGAGGAGAAPLPQAEPQVGFKDRMKGLAGGQPKEQIIPPLTPKEEMEQITQAKDSPEALMAFIQSDRGSESSKKEALKKMEEFRKNLPNFTFTEGTPEQIANLKMNLPSMIDEARQIVELEPFRREVNRAWATEKKNIESLIRDFSKVIGVTPSLAENWLNKDVDYTVDFDPLSDAPPRTISIREYFDDYLQNQVGKSLSDKADILTKLSKEKHAKKAGLDRWFGIKNEEVLDSYLGEKFPASKGMNQNQVAQPTPTLNVKNVRVKPPEQP